MTSRARGRACRTCGASAEKGIFCRMCGSRLDEGASGGDTAADWTQRVSRSYGLVHAVRDHARFALAFLQTRSGARRQLGFIDAELRRLHSEREQLLLALGGAAYHGDEEEAEQARAGIRALDEKMGHEHEKRRRVVEEASSLIERERRYVEPTQVVDRSGADEPAPSRKETE